MDWKKEIIPEEKENNIRIRDPQEKIKKESIITQKDNIEKQPIKEEKPKNEVKEKRQRKKS